MGFNTVASGDQAVAMGSSTDALGDRSLAMGSHTVASGNESVAIGGNTTSESGYETVLGRHNTDYTPNSVTGWHSADRLFVIGNGPHSGARSDAMVVLKNGNTGIDVSNPQTKLHVSSGNWGFEFNQWRHHDWRWHPQPKDVCF